MAVILGSERNLNVGTVSLLCGQEIICLLLTGAFEISLALYLYRCWLMQCVMTKERRGERAERQYCRFTENLRACL